MPADENKVSFVSKPVVFVSAGIIDGCDLYAERAGHRYDKNKKYFFIFKCIEKYFCLCYSKINLKQSKQDYTGDIIRGKQ